MKGRQGHHRLRQRHHISLLLLSRHNHSIEKQGSNSRAEESQASHNLVETNPMRFTTSPPTHKIASTSDTLENFERPVPSPPPPPDPSTPDIHVAAFFSE